MRFSVYLLRIIVAFFFGASVLCLVVDRFFATSADWRVENKAFRITMVIVMIVIALLSAILLWTIK